MEGGTQENGGEGKGGEEGMEKDRDEREREIYTNPRERSVETRNSNAPRRLSNKGIMAVRCSNASRLDVNVFTLSNLCKSEADLIKMPSKTLPIFCLITSKS
jgi:hypothetical protein